MNKLPWEPRVPNKYNLTIKDIENLKVGNLELVKEPLFWWNKIISAWCISCNVENESSFWIGIYSIYAPKNSGEFKFYIDCYAGNCFYRFSEFYNPEEIENHWDMMIQEKFLEKINELIDKGILIRSETSD